MASVENGQKDASRCEMNDCHSGMLQVTVSHLIALLSSRSSTNPLNPPQCGVIQNHVSVSIPPFLICQRLPLHFLERWHTDSCPALWSPVFGMLPWPSLLYCTPSVASFWCVQSTVFALYRLTLLVERYSSQPAAAVSFPQAASSKL